MEGLKKKYIINKADGSPMNPNAKYFILRYDEGMKDKKFLSCSRRALFEFCLDMIPINPLLSQELYNDITNETIKK